MDNDPPAEIGVTARALDSTTDAAAVPSAQPDECPPLAHHVDVIDLTRRIVSISGTGADRPAVDLSFSEYLAYRQRSFPRERTLPHGVTHSGDHWDGRNLESGEGDDVREPRHRGPVNTAEDRGVSAARSAERPSDASADAEPWA